MAWDRRKRPLDVRFWEKVMKTDGCWLWTASMDRHGYGQFCAGGRPKKAHRVAWFLTHGAWPTNALHRCDTPACVRPDHLFEGTKADNTADMMLKGRHRPVPRVTVCARGHAMTPGNIIEKHLATRGGKIARSCRACSLLKQRERRGSCLGI
jgi:hypothetical protein